MLRELVTDTTKWTDFQLVLIYPWNYNCDTFLIQRD